MIRSLYTAVSGLITQGAKQDVITNNIANVSTTGFKSDDLMVKDFKDVLIENRDKIVDGKNVTNTIGSLSLGSKIDGTSTNFQQGEITDSDNLTDFALQGNGFFTISKDNKDYYTRDGHFQVDASGYLIDDSGNYVKGKNLQSGTSGKIYIGKGKISTSGDGTISVDNVPKYKFSLADFNDYNTLKKVGDNLYEGTNSKTASNVSVKQKALEQSNVNVVNEMVNMMSVMRTFETNQKVLQSIDDTLDKVVNQVGSVK